VTPDTLLVGDCREVLKQFPDGCFDACITDPPYGIGAYKGDSKKVALIFPEVLPELHRVLRPGGALAFFGRWPTFYEWAIAARKAGFRQREELVWIAPRPSPGGDGHFMRQHSTTFVSHSVGGDGITWNVDPCREPYRYDGLNQGKVCRGVNHGDWHGRTGHLRVLSAHPRGATPCDVRRTPGFVDGRVHGGQKHIADCEWLVKLLTNEGDLVLDPFCGAGTIPLACANMGRRFTAMDIDPHWVEVSEKRLVEAASKRNLTLALEA